MTIDDPELGALGFSHVTPTTYDHHRDIHGNPIIHHRTIWGTPVNDIDKEQRRLILTWFQQMHAEGRLSEDLCWAMEVQCGFDPVSGEETGATTATYGCQLTFFGDDTSWVTGGKMVRDDA